MLVESQPVRPDRDPENGELLNYRTHVSKPDSAFNPYTIESFLAQIRLYRWVRSEDYVNFVIVDDLVNFLNFDGDKVSKISYGRVTVQSTRYNCRKLKAATMNNPKATWVFNLWNRLDMEYGLEWMICLWLRHLEPDADDLSDALDELATCSDRDLQSLFIDEFIELKRTTLPEKPNWIQAWNQFDLQPEKPRSEIRSTDRPRPVLRSCF